MTYPKHEYTESTESLSPIRVIREIRVQKSEKKSGGLFARLDGKAYFCKRKDKKDMDKQRYTLPEDKDGKVAEPAVACGTAAHDLPSEEIASAMEFAWKEHQAGRTLPLSSVLDEIKEARAWK